MTTLETRPPADDTPALYTVAEPRLLNSRPTHVPDRDHDWLVRAAGEVRMLGRGGAAFPVASKLAAVRRGAHVLVNGNEGEPASWKDRVLMRHYPDLVVAGATLVAGALRSPRTVIAVADAQAAGALMAAVRRTGAPIEIRHVQHRFAGGEMSALINGLNGHAPIPDGVRVLPHDRGLAGRPTYGSNVETFAQLALLSALGPRAYAAAGTPREPGTSLVTLHGTERDGVLEVPHGLEISRLLGDGPRPVLIGGYHGTWTTRTDLTVDREALLEHGITWGAGVVAALPDDTCPLGEVARVVHWLAGQSARQCGPCAFGLPAIADDLARLASGQPVDLDRLGIRIGRTTGRGACHHPTGAIRFVASALHVFDADLRRHAGGRPCGRPVRRTLPIGGPR